MNDTSPAVLGIGNILEYDDGIAVYASAYLEANFTFSPTIHIINGGVEGINLLDVFIEHQRIFVLDAIAIDDTPGSIYHIPAFELSGYGLNSGGAHEIGVMQCLDMLELMGKPLPEASVIGIVPQTIDVRIGLTDPLRAAFENYVNAIVKLLRAARIDVTPVLTPKPLEEIIDTFARQSRR